MHTLFVNRLAQGQMEKKEIEQGGEIAGWPWILGSGRLEAAKAEVFLCSYKRSQVNAHRRNFSAISPMLPIFNHLSCKGYCPHVWAGGLSAKMHRHVQRLMTGWLRHTPSLQSGNV